MPDFSDVVAAPGGKPETRAAVLAARRALSAAARASAAASIQVALADVVRRRRPTLVTAYAPIGPEPGGPDLPAVLAGALPPGGRLLLPILLPDLDLDWADYRGDEPLVATERGLREPAGGRLGVGAVARASLVVVPAVAVDPTGTRLGRGGGSFDRALARVGSEALVVAPLYDGELVDALHAEPHDRRVDAVVTPGAGLIHLGPRRGGGAHTAGRDRVG
ncbi:MAG TPA: 5-formyltetrahydrofolate cyclo-ligase [Micromonosporaceae bacterium]